LRKRRPLRGFDFSFNPQIPVKKIKQLANCAYIDNAKMSFFWVPSAWGKAI